MASAHGKVILLGEHAVVYGVPALALGIDRGAQAVAEPRASEVLSIDGRPARDAEALRAFGELSKSLGAPEVTVRATLEIPAGSGLGASAALGVAIAKALLEWMGEPVTAERALGAAEAWERVFHGNPSGIDMAAAYHGRCFKFRRGHEPEFLALGARVRLAVARAGPPASTKLMVESVAKLRQRRPDLVDKTLEGIQSLVHNAALCLGAGDLIGLGKLMDYNQMLLSGLFLSTPEIERACGIARDHGAFGAKLTGAGGGGAVIALSDEPERIVESWRTHGIEAFVADCADAPAAEAAPERRA